MTPADLPTRTWKALRDLPTSLQQITRRENYELNLLAVGVGLLTGYAAIGFRFLIGSMQNFLLFDQWDYHLISPIGHVRGYWMFLILPLGLLVSQLITHFFAREAKGHGVPEVIESIWKRDGVMRKRVFLLKALASSITIASGGSVGREGPIVQIGAGIGSTLGQFLKLRPKLLKTLVGCGAAGAIAATFNTPIAGVVFAIEIIILEMKTRSFVPLVISSVFATVISRSHLGNEPAFFVPNHTLTGPHELLLYLGLGVTAGLVGVFLIKFLYATEDFFAKLPLTFWQKPLVAGLILAGVGVFFPQMYGVGYETISQVLQENGDIQLMFLFIFLKIFCTSLTLGGGGSGGVFAPSLFVGAMLGGSYGYFANEFFPNITESYDAYALVGMAALFSATGRATFTAIVILFEMTLDYSIILPLMFVCVTADQVALALSKESIYSMKLKRKGLKFSNQLSVNLMSMTLVSDVMTKDLHVANKGMSVLVAAQRLLPFGHSVIPLVDDDQQLIGIVPKEKLEEALHKTPDAPIEQLLESVRATVYDNDSVDVAIQKIQKHRDPRILVLSHLDQKLIGIVSPVDVVRLNTKDEED